MEPSTSPKDWLDIVVALGLIGLAVDRWVHGRERSEDRQSGEIQHNAESIVRVERERKEETNRLWESIDDIHAKASTMSSEFQIRGGNLDISCAKMGVRLDGIESQMKELWRNNDRRHISRNHDDMLT